LYIYEKESENILITWNRTKLKIIPIDRFQSLCDRYDYFPDLIINKSNPDSRASYINGKIIIYTSKHETSNSYYWLYCHEYFHMLIDHNKAAQHYLSRFPTDARDSIEEMFCNIFATIEAKGQYDGDWLVKRSKK